MNFTPKLKQKIESYKNNIILVEGKKDRDILLNTGFVYVFQIHKNNLSIRESLEEMSNQIEKNKKISILTDLDKQGNYFNKQATSILQELGITIDQSFRKLLIKANISHIEGIYNFLEKVENT